MPTFPIPATGPTAVVVNPSGLKLADGATANVGLGQQQETTMRELGGRYQVAAQRGFLFMASTAIAGVTVPAPAGTLASKAGMINPLGSGVNVELVALGISSVTIDVALKQFMMEFQTTASTTGGAATSVTKLTSVGLPISTNKSNPQAFAYNAATMTNVGANPLLIPISNVFETAVGAQASLQYFNGEVYFGPDTVMAITNTASFAAVNFFYAWIEWPA